MGNTKEIFTSEMAQYLGQACPECHEGVLQEGASHDGMGGKGTVLQCSRLNPCGGTIEVLMDPLINTVHRDATMEGVPRI